MLSQTQTLALLLLLLSCHSISAKSSSQRPLALPGWVQPTNIVDEDDKVAVSAVERYSTFGDVLHTRATASAYRKMERKAPAVPETELEYLEQVYGLSTTEP